MAKVRYKVTTTLLTPFWASAVVSILSMAMAILILYNGIVGFTRYQGGIGWGAFLFMYFYLFGGFILFFGGLISIPTKKRRGKLLVRKTFSLASQLSIFFSLYNGITFLLCDLIMKDTSFFSQQIAFFHVFSICMFFLFIVTAILLIVVGRRIRTNRSFKVIGLIASGIFFALILTEFVALLSNGVPFLVHPTSDVIEKIVFGLALVIPAFLIIISITSQLQIERTRVQEFDSEGNVVLPSMGPRPSSLSEEEKIKALSRYKDLLDQGAITPEEYEKKKKELLR